MINKAMKDYMEKNHSPEANLEGIFLKQEEETRKRNHLRKKIGNMVAVLLVIVVVGAVSSQIYGKIQWNIQFKEYQNREYETGSGILKEAVDSGYYEKVDMDYVTQDDISVKVDSLIMTDDKLEAKINFQFADTVQVDSENFSFGYAIYDEEKNVYGVFTRMHIGTKEKRDTYTPYMYQEIGAKYDKHNLYDIQLCDTAGIGLVSVNEENREIVSKITMGSMKGFPKSKKLYIRIFDLGYSMTQQNMESSNKGTWQAEDFPISDAEWIFSIDVPEKFYQRQSMELKLKEEIPGVEIEKMAVTELGLVIKAKIEGIDDKFVIGKDLSPKDWQKLRNETMYITDGEGTVYYENTMGTVQGKDWVRMNYEINKNTFSKRLFLHVKINEISYTSELIEK